MPQYLYRYCVITMDYWSGKNKVSVIGMVKYEGARFPSNYLQKKKKKQSEFKQPDILFIDYSLLISSLVFSWYVRPLLYKNDTP